MSFQDSAVIFFLALLLFGPKKLPELARQLGKLMGEFRRASNEFRMQMEDELRLSEQAERQKQIAAIEAAAPPQVAAELAPAATAIVETHPSDAITMPEPVPFATPAHRDAAETPIPEHSILADTSESAGPAPPDRYRHQDEAAAVPAAKPMPIATSGSLHMMPPATGLPVGRNGAGVAQAFEAIPPAPEDTAQAHSHQPAHETGTHG